MIQVAKIIETESLNIKVDHALHDACELDLSKFCRDVSPGGGKQLICLRNVYDDKNLNVSLPLNLSKDFAVAQLTNIHQRAILAIPQRHMKI